MNLYAGHPNGSLFLNWGSWNVWSQRSGKSLETVQSDKYRWGKNEGKWKSQEMWNEKINKAGERKTFKLRHLKKSTLRISKAMKKNV